jgi:hypothetical protein
MEDDEKGLKDSIEDCDDLIDWANQETERPQWVLTRQDDNGFEVEMFRFNTENEAKRVAKKYQDRGQKQLYMVYKIT